MMKATKTSSPILSNELYSELVKKAIDLFDEYVKGEQNPDTIPIKKARRFIVYNLNREYQQRLRLEAQQRLRWETLMAYGKIPFRTTLRDIAEAAAMIMSYERQAPYYPKNYMWVKA